MWQRGECTKAGFDLLPQEVIVQNIFSAFSYGELLILAEVSQEWNSLCADDRLWQNLYLKKWNRKEQGTNSSDTEQELQTLQPIPSSPRILTRDRREAIVDPPPISLMLNGSTSIDSSQPVPPSGIQLRTETISGGSTPPHSPGRPKKVAQIGSMRRSAEARPVEGTLNNFDLLRSLQQLPQEPQLQQETHSGENWKQKFKEKLKEETTQLETQLWSDIEQDVLQKRGIILLDGEVIHPNQSPIQSATLEKAVIYITRPNTLLANDLHFLRSFLATLLGFTTPNRFFRLLAIRYRTPQLEGGQIRPRVLNVLRTWMSSHWSHFEGNMWLQQRITTWVNRYIEGSYKSMATAIKKLMARKSVAPARPNYFAWRHVKEIIPENIRNLRSIFDLTDEDVARQMTLIEFDSFHAIKPEELLEARWTKEKKHILSPNVTMMTEFFNRMSMWLGTEILAGETPKDRVKTLRFFMRVGALLNEYQNYNSLMAIISGLSSASVYRLKSTWALVPKAELTKWNETKELMSREQNFLNFRQQIEQCTPPCIPYLGVYLTDLTFITETGPSPEAPVGPLGSPMINFRRRVLTYDVLSRLQGLQQVSYNYEVDFQVQNFLLQRWGHCLDENTLYKKSLQLEPKQPSGRKERV